MNQPELLNLNMVGQHVILNAKKIIRSSGLVRSAGVLSARNENLKTLNWENPYIYMKILILTHLN